MPCCMAKGWRIFLSLDPDSCSLRRMKDAQATTRIHTAADFQNPRSIKFCRFILAKGLRHFQIILNSRPKKTLSGLPHPFVAQTFLRFQAIQCTALPHESSLPVLYKLGVTCMDSSDNKRQKRGKGLRVRASLYSPGQKRVAQAFNEMPYSVRKKKITIVPIVKANLFVNNEFTSFSLGYLFDCLKVNNIIS